MIHLSRFVSADSVLPIQFCRFAYIDLLLLIHFCRFTYIDLLLLIHFCRFTYIDLLLLICFTQFTSADSHSYNAMLSTLCFHLCRGYITAFCNRYRILQVGWIRMDACRIKLALIQRPVTIRFSISFVTKEP